MGILPATRLLSSRDGERPQVDGRLADTLARSHVGIALVVLYVLSVVARAVLASKVASPFVFYDELGYARVAQSIATGHGLALFGHAGLSYSPLYPLILAPIYAFHPAGSTAYGAIKVVNASVMSLAVFPTYGIARAVLARRDALVVALLGTLTPLMLYTGLVLSENVAYPCALCAIWATLVTLRAPSVRHDAIFLVTTGAATAARVELSALFPMALIAIAVGGVMGNRGDKQPRWRRAVSRLAAHRLLLGVTAITVVVGAGIKLAGIGVSAAAGRYAILSNGASIDWWSSTWVVLQHIAELDIALGVLPFVGVLVAAGVFLTGRRSERSIAFATVALLVTLVLTAEVAYDVAFTADWGDAPRIHERYLIYLVPFFLTAFVAALRFSQVVTNRRAYIWSWAVALALPALIPFGTVVNDTIIGDTFGLAPLARGVGGEMLPLPHETLLAVFLAAAIGAVAVLLRAHFVASVAAAAVLLVGWSAAAETRIVFAARDNATYAGQRDWVDGMHPGGSVVLVTTPGMSKAAMLETAFFNPSIGRLYSLCVQMITEADFGDQIVTVSRTGRLLNAGKPLSASLVVAPATLPLRGRVIARHPGGLVLVEPANGILALRRGIHRAAC